MHALQALVERSHQIFPGTPVAVRARPHVVTCLRGYEQLVAVGSEVLIHQSAHRFLCRAVDRTVVVGQIKVGDAVVEGVVGDLTAALIGVDASEVMPEAEAYLRQQHTRAPAALKLHPVVVAALVRKVQFLHVFVCFSNVSAKVVIIWEKTPFFLTFFTGGTNEESFVCQ